MIAGCSDSGGDAGAEDEVSAPERWDPRVTALVDFVEEARDLEFRRPVHVDFLQAEAFREEVTRDRADLTDEEEGELVALEGLTRALGLTSGDFDLLEAGNDFAGDGILAFYDPETKRVAVKGAGDLSVSVKATLVHELTHALQDQHFDLGRLGELETDGADSAFQAVVEGDATRIENLWAAELSDEERAAYARETADVTEEAEGGLADVPEWLRTLFGAPYALGLPFVEAVIAEGGPKALDRAFRSPPESEEQVVDPVRYLAGDTPEQVAAPEPAGGQTEVDQADFGVLGWVVVLADRLGSADVIRAVDGWGGDAYLTYTEGGRTCVDVRVVGEDDGETDDLAEVLSHWAASAGTASVARTEDFVALTSCAPEPGAAPAERPTGAAGAEVLLTRLATRSALFAGTLGQGASPADADCYADTFVGGLSDEDLAATEATPELEAAAGEAARACFGQ